MARLYLGTKVVCAHHTKIIWYWVKQKRGDAVKLNRNGISIFAFGLSSTLLMACGERSDKGMDSEVEVLKSTQTSGFDLPAKTVAFTFDDGPGLGTVALANWLKAQGVPSTFFVVGKVAKNNTKALAAIKAAGHLVANHSTNHPVNPPFVKLSESARLAEIRNTDAVIKPYITGNMFLFRAPGGSWNSRSATISNVADLRKYVGPVFWDVGGQLTSRHAADYACWGRNISVQECGRRYLNEILDRPKNNGVILLHDIHDRTLSMVKQVLVPALKSRGFKFVRLDQVPNIAKELKANGGNPGSRLTEEMPCSEPPVALLSQAKTSFKMEHGVGGRATFEANLTTSEESSTALPEFTHQFQVEHNPADKTTMGFKLVDQGASIEGVRYQFENAPDLKVPFVAQWKCNKYVGQFKYKMGGKEDLEISLR